LEAKKKQRHTAKRVYDRLFVLNTRERLIVLIELLPVTLLRKKQIFGKNKGFLPLEHIPGEAQLDFGEAEYFENGTLRSGHHLNLSFPYSNQGFTQLLPGENQECLFEGMIAIFEHMGMVPRKIWFDNASTIVTKILKKDDRLLTDSFLRFAEHYGFQYVFCNPNRGNEKGNVENKVGYHRRNLLVPRPRLSNLADFNAELLQKCDEDAKRIHYRKNVQIDELYEVDKARLLPLPTVPLNVSRYVTVKTNAYGRFYLEKGLHEYSVSPKFASSKVLVEITANEVIPLDENQREITRHKRLYGGHKQQSMDWLPYLTQLSRYPRALKYTGIYQMLPHQCKRTLKAVQRPIAVKSSGLLPP